MFNIGPSTGSGFPDWLKQKTGGNTGVTGGMNRSGWGRSSPGQDGTFNRPRPQGPSMGRPSGNSPFGMGPMQPPVSTTMPVGRPRPNIIPMPQSMDPGIMPGGGMQQPTQQPIEENQLWRTYNRLLGGPMAPRMLF